MRILRKPHPLTMFAAWFLTVFLVLFPKGGLKIGGLPLTWGYLFLASTAPLLLLVRLVALPLRQPVRVWVAVALLVPMQLLCLYSLMFYGVNQGTYAVSMFTGLFFLPWIFLLIYPPFLGYVDGERFSRYFRTCIFAAAVWGIFLFFWHPLTGHFVEIPYLTVNADDFGDLEYTKHINRGLFFKLISTYNNGNLYGVATLILLPLYELLERKRWRRAVVKIALLFTLSRTVWAGLIAAEMMPLGLLMLRQVPTFPRVYLGRAWKAVLTLLVTVALIFAALLFNSSKLSFLFDPTLGGRSTLIDLFFHASLLPTQGLSAFQEILYASITGQFGYAGLVAWTLIMLGPLLLLLLDSSALQSPSRRAGLKGLILYAVLAASDGGFNYIPIMAFYWFAYMIYIFGWPAPRSSASVRLQAASQSAAPVLDCTPSAEPAR